MKKQTLILLILLSVSSFGYGQTKDKLDTLSIVTMCCGSCYEPRSSRSYVGYVNGVQVEITMGNVKDTTIDSLYSYKDFYVAEYWAYINMHTDFERKKDTVNKRRSLLMADKAFTRFSEVSKQIDEYFKH